MVLFVFSSNLRTRRSWKSLSLIPFKSIEKRKLNPCEHKQLEATQLLGPQYERDSECWELWAGVCAEGGTRTQRSWDLTWASPISLSRHEHSSFPELRGYLACHCSQIGVLREYSCWLTGLRTVLLPAITPPVVSIPGSQPCPQF